MKQFALGLAIGAALTISCQQYFSQPDIPQSTSANTTTAVISSVSDNKTQSVAIAPSQLPQECSPVASKTIVEKTTPATSDASKELESLRAQVQMHEQRREAEKLAQFGNGEALADLTRKQFEQETIDSSWASSYQNQLSHVFRSDEKLNDVVPQSIECRASRCRINIAVANQQQFNQVAGKLVSSITSGEHHDITAKILVSPVMEQGMLQLYVARDLQVSLIP